METLQRTPPAEHKIIPQVINRLAVALQLD